MSLASEAKNKAYQLIRSSYAQADPKINTGVGSAVHATVVLPSSLIYAGMVNDIDGLRQMYLGNYASLSEADMDLLAGIKRRPQGSRSIGIVRVYPRNLEPFALEPYPYFRSINGTQYRPVTNTSFGISDFISVDGEFFVNVPVISTSFGPLSASAADEINEYSNLPIDVRRVNNIEATQGGRSRMDNEDFFNFLKTGLNDGSMNQRDGIMEHIQSNIPEVGDVKIVTAGDPLLLRDEVWSLDSVHPNLSREGWPFAPRVAVPLGLDFDLMYGRASCSAPFFTEEMVGQRIAISGDIEKFRTILRVIDSKTAVISGFPMSGVFPNAEILEWGPRIHVMADVYIYFPEIQIQSTVVDKRYLLQATATAPGRVYVSPASGFAYPALPNQGKIVVREGTESETVRIVSGGGEGPLGRYLSVNSSGIAAGSAISLYDMSEIVVGEDILDRPVLYVLQVDQLHPMSFESMGAIPRSSPDSYTQPGWFVSNTDPAEVFSTRERKSIVLDEKLGNPAFVSINETVDVTDATPGGESWMDQTTNPLTQTFDWLLPDENVWDNRIGREVLITLAERTLQTNFAEYPSSMPIVNGGDILIVDGLNIKYDSRHGYRDDIIVRLFDAGNNLVGEHGLLPLGSPSDVYVWGNSILTKGGPFNATATHAQVWVPSIHHGPISSLVGAGPPNVFPFRVTQNESGGAIDELYVWSGSDWTLISKKMPGSNVDRYTTTAWFPAREFESVVLEVANLDYSPHYESQAIRVLLPDGEKFSVTADIDGMLPTRVKITADSQEGSFGTSPVRVVYATHSDFSGMQSIIDDSSTSLLCKDTLVRSFFPSLIDATIRYRGASSSEEVFQRFVDLIGVVASEVDNGQRARLDISNIVAALDEEGLADSIDVNFEIRVTDYLPDGEFQVRYLNPSESTKQAFSFLSEETSNIVILRKGKSTAAVSGRGLLYLGGNDPSRQEVIPYEAVVDMGPGELGANEYMFVLRNGWGLQYPHDEWETVYVTARDYDPSLEFDEGAIFIASNNRPYVRQLVVIKE